MSRPEGPPPPWARGKREQAPPLPGQQALVTAGMVMGFVLLGAQLWLLTVALDLYLAGRAQNIWILALVSGAIAAGGLWIVFLLNLRPRVQRLTTDESGRHVRRFEDHP